MSERDEGILLRLDGVLPTNYYCAALTFAPGNASRPEVQPGGKVVALFIKDEHGELEIPWPEGMTAREALLAWRAEAQ